MKELSSEEENIGIRKCRIRSRVEIINKEVKEWISSSKQQEPRPEITHLKNDIGQQCQTENTPNFTHH